MYTIPAFGYLYFSAIVGKKWCQMNRMSENFTNAFIKSSPIQKVKQKGQITYSTTAPLHCFHNLWHKSKNRLVKRKLQHVKLRLEYTTQLFKSEQKSCSVSAFCSWNWMCSMKLREYVPSYVWYFQDKFIVAHFNSNGPSVWSVNNQDSSAE